MAKEKKGLGTGLGVLFGEDRFEQEEELQTLPIGKVEPRRDQPRAVFDEQALQELADSIAPSASWTAATIRSSQAKDAGAPPGSRV